MQKKKEKETVSTLWKQKGDKKSATQVQPWDGGERETSVKPVKLLTGMIFRARDHFVKVLSDLNAEFLALVIYLVSTFHSVT